MVDHKNISKRDFPRWSLPNVGYKIKNWLISHKAGWSNLTWQIQDDECEKHLPWSNFIVEIGDLYTNCFQVNKTTTLGQNDSERHIKHRMSKGNQPCTFYRSNNSSKTIDRSINHVQELTLSKEIKAYTLHVYQTISKQWWNVAYK